MTPEKILEIARRYTVPELRQESTTDESVVWPMTYWEFCEEELLAFAQSVVEAEREARKMKDKDIYDVISKQRFFYGADANAYTFARAIERQINGEEE